MFPATFSSDHRSRTVQKLRARLSRFQRGLRLETRARRTVSTGIATLDDMLPDQGLPRSTLSEWIAAERGSGVAMLALRAGGQAQREGPLIVVDSERTFYAPAFRAAGVRIDETILVRPESRNEALWAVEQSLRCSGVGAVLCRVDRLRTQEFRRLQLAAEAGTAIGILIRPAAARRQPGWADVRLLVTPVPSGSQSFFRRMEVRCIYAKGGFTDRSIQLDVSDETGVVCLAAAVSDSATALRTAWA